jgi:hypothetical protein
VIATLKVIWLETSIQYYFDENEDIFKKDFFVFINGTNLITDYTIEMTDEYAEVIFDDPSISIVAIDGSVFFRGMKDEEDEEPEEPKDEDDEDFDFGDFEEEPIPPNHIVLQEENVIFVTNVTEEEIKLPFVIKEYMKETYPDFAQKVIKREIKIKPNKKEILAKSMKGKYVEVELESKVYTLEFVPSYYFTTVAALKEYIQTTGLIIEEKTDEQLKDKIVEKSTLLKKKFGLLKEHVEDFELYPAYKKLVHLYCIYDFIIYGFINGDVTDTNSSSSVGDKKITLGKFTAEDDNGFSNNSNGTNYLPDLIKNKIDIAEEDLKSSIFNKSVSFSRKGGNYVLGNRVQKSFRNW